MTNIRQITFLVLLTVWACMTAHSQKNVLPLPLDSGTTIKGNTLCYMLPTTALKVTVDITKVREIKGYYAEYAQSLLGLTNVISENKTFCKVNDVRIEPVEVPDFNHAYLVQLSSQQMKDAVLTKTAQKKTMTCALSKEVQPYLTYSEPIPNFFKNYSDLSYSEMEDSFVETKIIDGIVTQVPANRTKIVSKTNSQKAQEAADAISKSRKDQYSLASGEQETPYPAETLEAMLQELRQWEENYLSLFTGLVLEDIVTYTFYVIPEEGATTLPIFSCSQTEGFSTENLANNANAYTLNLKPTFPTDGIEQALTDSKPEKKATKSGYRFRKAMPVAVSLHQGQKSLHDFGIFNMRQFGRIQTLPTGQNKEPIQQFGFIF